MNPKSVPFVPVSAWRGENLTDGPSKLPWFQGWNVEYKSGPASGVLCLFSLVLHCGYTLTTSCLCIPVFEPAKKIRGTRVI